MITMSRKLSRAMVAMAVGLSMGNTAALAASEVLRRSRPEAAVVDYQLPDGDGLAVLRRRLLGEYIRPGWIVGQDLDLSLRT